MIPALHLLLALFTPTSGVVWTQNHGFAVGGEVEFTQSDSADWVTTVPYVVKTLQITSGSINYNTHGKAGASVALFRIAVIGDSAGGDSGAGPGSVLIINTPIYVFHGEAGHERIEPFTVRIDPGRIPVQGIPAPADGSPYQFKVHVDAAGAVWPAHVEIALAGMWS